MKIDQSETVALINEADFICITESWLSQSIPDTAMLLSNFILFRNDRVSSAVHFSAVHYGGGAFIFIKSCITCRRIKEFENPSFESRWLSVRP